MYINSEFNRPHQFRGRFLLHYKVLDVHQPSMPFVRRYSRILVMHLGRETAAINPFTGSRVHLSGKRWGEGVRQGAGGGGKIDGDSGAPRLLRSWNRPPNTSNM
ncbi:hypothetical protein J6590_068620 [Homalodisca vitripennis]|nr:hypothetical protein J6590_068620 [Homalodisca vitripennis]